MFIHHIFAAAALSAAVLAAPASKRTYQFHESNSTSASNGTSNPNANNLALIYELELAPTAVDRLALLSAADFKYDYNNPPSNAVTTGLGGHTVRADRRVFPALIGTGVSMTVGFIGPCGFNTPHVHPRSSEINIIVQGRLGTEFILENGAPAITNTLDQFQMTVFPQGATHTEFNPDCEDAVFVAGFASEDPGVEQSAQTLFGLDPEIVKADLGVQAINGESIDEFRNMLPHNVALGVESCLAKCGIAKKTKV